VWPDLQQRRPPIQPPHGVLGVALVAHVDEGKACRKGARQLVSRLPPRRALAGHWRHLGPTAPNLWGEAAAGSTLPLPRSAFSTPHTYTHTRTHT
jgi:hypothetical protein